MSREQYATNLKNLRQYTNDDTRNGKLAQGIIEDMENETKQLQKLRLASQNASGALDAIQYGNEINALQILQTMRLQTLIAANQNSQASAQALEIYRQAAAAELAEKFYNTKKVT